MTASDIKVELCGGSSYRVDNWGQVSELFNSQFAGMHGDGLTFLDDATALYNSDGTTLSGQLVRQYGPIGIHLASVNPTTYRLVLDSAGPTRNGYLEYVTKNKPAVRVDSAIQCGFGDPTNLTNVNIRGFGNDAWTEAQTAGRQGSGVETFTRVIARNCTVDLFKGVGFGCYGNGGIIDSCAFGNQNGTFNQTQTNNRSMAVYHASASAPLAIRNSTFETLLWRSKHAVHIANAACDVIADRGRYGLYGYGTDNSGSTDIANEVWIPATDGTTGGSAFWFNLQSGLPRIAYFGGGTPTASAIRVDLADNFFLAADGATLTIANPTWVGATSLPYSAQRIAIRVRGANAAGTRILFGNAYNLKGFDPRAVENNTDQTYVFQYNANGATWDLIQPPANVFYDIWRVAPIFQTTRSNFTGAIGYEFQPRRSMTVTELARQGSSADTQDHLVQLWQKTVTGAPLASVSIPHTLSLVGGFRRMPVAAVALAAGTNYFILSDENNAGDSWRDEWAPTSLLDGLIRREDMILVGGAYKSTLSAYPDTLLADSSMFNGLGFMYR